MSKKRFNKGKMARRLVYLCITVLILTLIWAVVLKTIALFYNLMFDISDVLTFAAGANRVPGERAGRTARSCDN
jgi:hypothetical protein